MNLGGGASGLAGWSQPAIGNVRRECNEWVRYAKWEGCHTQDRGTNTWHLSRRSHLSQLLHMNTGVHTKQKAGRACHGHTRQLVLAADKLRNQLGRQIRLADILGVMRREVIPRQTEGTHPQLGAKVDLAVGIEDGVTRGGGAANGIVLQRGGRRGGGGKLLEGRVQRAYGGHAAGGFEPRGGPAVEGQAGSRCFFSVRHVPVLLLLHGQLVDGLWRQAALGPTSEADVGSGCGAVYLPQRNLWCDPLTYRTYVYIHTHVTPSS